MIKTDYRKDNKKYFYFNKEQKQYFRVYVITTK